MGRELVPEHSAKDLRGILDTNLAYDEHIIKTSGMSCLSQMSRTKHVFDETHSINHNKRFIFQ